MASPPADVLFGDAASSVHPAGHDGGGSYVPVIVVPVLIALVTAASVAVGQLFVGSRGRRRTGYDMEAYVVRRFSTCLGVADPAVQLVRPVDDKKKMKAPFVQLDDGAEEVVEPSAGAPKADDDETATSQKTLP